MAALDLRAWNLYRFVLAGACVGAGACTARSRGDVIDTDATASEGVDEVGDADGVDASDAADAADAADATGTTSGTDGDSFTTGAPPTECVNDVDCTAINEVCIDGQCEWYYSQDGSQPYYGPCAYPNCDPDQVCFDDACRAVEAPDPCGGSSLGAIPVESGQNALTLTFSDLNEDGAQELVVVSSDEIRVYASPPPSAATVSPRAMPGRAAEATAGPVGNGGAMALVMRAGGTDAVGLQAWTSIDGSSLSLSQDLAAGTQHHPALPATTLGVASIRTPGARTILTDQAWGDLDAASWSAGPLAAPDDVVAWIPPGWGGEPNPRFVVHDLQRINVIDAVETDLEFQFYPYRDKWSASFVDVVLAEQLFIGTFEHDGNGGFSHLFAFDAGGLLGAPGVRCNGAVRALVSADVDGDGVPEIAYAMDDAVGVFDGMAASDPDGRCRAETAYAGGVDDLAAGDLDGDGRDEIALLTGAGDVLLVE